MLLPIHASTQPAKYLAFVFCCIRFNTFQTLPVTGCYVNSIQQEANRTIGPISDIERENIQPMVYVHMSDNDIAS